MCFEQLIKDKASKEDIETTKLIMKGAELLKIQLLDHIVIGFNESQSCMPKVA